MGDAKVLPTTFDAAVLALAASEPDAEVRCQVLSMARRLPFDQALPLAGAIAARGELDVADPFIPLMTWFTIESHCAGHRDAVLALFAQDAPLWRAPLARQHLVGRLMRRFAAAGTRADFATCAALLAAAPGDDQRKLLLAGFEEAFKGRALPPLPDDLSKALAATGHMTLALRVRNNDPAALAEALKQATDPRAKPADRLTAVHLLGDVKHAPAVAPLLAIVVSSTEPAALRAAACAALQPYEDPTIGQTLAEAFPDLPAAAVRPTALNLLASRPAWSARLLESFAAGKVPRAAFTPDVLARLRLHKDDATLTALLDKHFPAKPPQARADLRPRVDAVRKIIAEKPGDPYKGEPLFTERCSGCHTLFFKGGKTGPDLTPYQRDDLGTMLTSVVDPNAEIREGYENYLVTTKDGRSLSGFLADQDKNVVVLRGFDNADLMLKRDDIAKLEPAGRSLMPEGLLDELEPQEIRDLFAYLRQSQPIINPK
jgi:putative heme-binding domain-containing protein